MYPIKYALTMINEIDELPFIIIISLITPITSIGVKYCYSYFMAN